MKILLAIDGSEASQNLVETVGSRPWLPGTRFVVLHVVNMAALGRFAAMLDHEKKAAQTLVAAAAEKLNRVGLDAGTDVLVGFPRRTIADYAKELGADFIMVGSHGESAIARFLLGSVAQAVLRSAPCSVEIVRPKVEGTWRKTKAMKILLATDGSENSAIAAKSVMTRPWPEGTRIKIISVAELVPGSEILASSSCPTYPAGLLEKIWNDACKRACEAVEGEMRILETAKMRISLEKATPQGDPRVLLVKRAKEWKADLIVLGSHGRHGIDRVLLGSVSEFVALHAPCSVEIIRENSETMTKSTVSAGVVPVVCYFD